MLTISPTVARRLAVTRQRLAGPRPTPDAAGILEVVQDLGCLQLDPTNAVARTHLLVLWSRLGGYDPADLERLRWEDRRFFEYWAHAASIVLTENYPIHADQMRAAQESDSPWGQRVRAWMETNHALRSHILDTLRDHGPRQSAQFEDLAVEPWESSGWTQGRNVGRMLDMLWSRGQVMVAGRVSGQKVWDLTDRFLPPGTPRAVLPPAEVTRRAAQKALRALGVATPKQMDQHYTRGFYPGLDAALADLAAEGQIVPVALEGEGRAWPGPWYVHAADRPLLERLAAGHWEPRTTLLSPFDNLICDRQRTEQLFDFNYRIEIYVPKTKRQYGFYVLPILHGDRFIGRIDPTMDRKTGRLHVNAVYAEPDAPQTAETGEAVAGAIADLAAFLGAREIVYSDKVPAGWRIEVMSAEC
jgi:uncharacterized protein YcaQ